MAEGCVRNSAPVIPIAKTKAGRMIFITLVCRKGSEGCLILCGKSVAEAGNAVSSFRSSWNHSLFSMPTEVLHSSVQMHAVVCILLFFLPILQLSFRTFPCPFYTALLHLFESWVSIWVLFLQSLMISWPGWLGEESRLRENEWWCQEHTEMCLNLWTMLFPLGLPVSLIIPLLTSGVNN